jgi:hypothetical protein
MAAAVLNLVGALALVLTGDALALVAVRGLIALIVFAYLVSPAGRRALGATSSV